MLTRVYHTYVAFITQHGDALVVCFLCATGASQTKTATRTLGTQNMHARLFRLSPLNGRACNTLKCISYLAHSFLVASSSPPSLRNTQFPYIVVCRLSQYANWTGNFTFLCVVTLEFNAQRDRERVDFMLFGLRALAGMLLKSNRHNNIHSGGRVWNRDRVRDAGTNRWYDHQNTRASLHATPDGMMMIGNVIGTRVERVLDCEHDTRHTTVLFCVLGVTGWLAGWLLNENENVSTPTIRKRNSTSGVASGCGEKCENIIDKC